MSVPKKVIDYIKKSETVSVDDLVLDLNLSASSAMNYLSRLSKMEFVNRIGHGLYQIGQKSEVNITFSPYLSNIVDFLKNKFLMADFIIWSLSMLGNYTHYTIGKDLIFIETNKVLSASIRDSLVDNGYSVILNPNSRDFRDYTYSKDIVTFIIERKEKYGLNDIGFKFPTIERIWVDIYYYITRKDLSFSPYELGIIFSNLINMKSINFDRLLYYSKRRGIRDEMIIFLYNLNKMYIDLIPMNILVGKREALKVLEEVISGATS